MKTPLFIYIFFVFLFSTKVFAQESSKKPNIGIAVGYTGFQNSMFEIGIGYQPWEVESDLIEYPFAGFLLLYEFAPNKNLYGTSLNAMYLGGPFSCGLSVNRYSDYVNETYGLKPMIGFSFRRIGVMYGFNYFLSENEIADLPRHTFTIKYYLPIWKKK